jgi:ligand-binding sensor domain-containing protein
MENNISYPRISRVRYWVVVVVVLITLLLIARGVSSQTPEWIVYNTENSEIPSNEVIELAVDPSGGLWMGTRGGGLAKVDGETWTVYTTDNSQLPSNTVPAMAFDTRGQLWGEENLG